MRLENDLKPHNKETYGKLKNILQTNNKTCIIQPTGSGKSYLILKLIEDYSASGRDIIIIEPQKYIFDQLQKKMEKYELTSDNVKFLTYSALGKLNDEKIQEYQSPKLVIIDEMHRAGAPKWGVGLQMMFDTFPTDCKYVGFSATPIRFLDGKRNMAEELFNNCIANEIGLADAILNRILPLPRYIAGLYTYDNEVNVITRKIENSRNTEEEKAKLLEEVAIMKKNLDKSKGVSAIFKKYIDGNKGKYVAFCRNINHLKLMRTCLEQWFSEAGIMCNFYEVHCKNPEKGKQFNAFMNDTGLSVCLSVAMLSEGVHGIDGVILLRDTTSPNLYYQQIGRVFAVDMDTVPIIFDLVANCESIMDCNLKNDLLNAIDKRDGNKVNEAACVDGGRDNEKVNNSKDNDAKDITKDDIESFFVFDQVIDAVNAFKEIEDKIILVYKNWTCEEENMLKENWFKGREYVQTLFPQREWNSIKGKASHLGVIDGNLNWTSEEDALFRELYLQYGTASYDMMPNRNRTACILRRKRLKLRKTKNNNRDIFTEEYDKIIKEKYSELGGKCCVYMNNITERQVISRANKLGIGKKKTSQYKYVSWNNKKGKYAVQFQYNGKNLFWGYFDNEDEAGRVAIQKAKEYGKAI